ncbi:MAG: hypothetical protein ACW99G_01375 [Candidatus Thorarchaeota archaeon]|jgi:hypothetical protein
MPCRSYEPPQSEIDSAREIFKVKSLLKELKTGKPVSEEFHWGNVEYIDKDGLDKKTAELCKKLQTTDVTKYSLEMQIWWRDHQRADKKRLQKEMKKKKKSKEKKDALSKLTPYERKLLGH